MRDLRTNEMDQVSGGTFGLLSWLFCKPVVSYCPPAKPKYDDCKPKKPAKKGC